MAEIEVAIPPVAVSIKSKIFDFFSVRSNFIESGSFRSGRFGPGRFGPISEVSRFGPIWTGRFGPISKVGHFGPILGLSRFGLIYELWESYLRYKTEFT